MKLVGLVDDVFLLSKIEGTIKNKGLDIKFLSADDIENREFDWVIVDMHHADAFRIIDKFPDKALCFGAHTRTELFDKAKSAGCKHAYSRSVFFEKLPKKLSLDD